MTVIGSRVCGSNTVSSGRGVNCYAAQAFNDNKRDDFSIVAWFRGLIPAARST